MAFVIETVGLTKYYGKTRGMEDVNLQVREGEIFGFIGPNGAGKSTMIRTLLNFIFPTRGKATIFGMDCVSDTRAIKQQIGYLPAEVSYYDDMTVEQVFAYSARFYGKDCSKRTDELTALFEVDTKKRVDSLSLGNKKKVGIVQALLHQPKLLILDEPTGGLDPLMQRRFQDLLREENIKGTTVFFSSHVLGEVQKLCNRVAIIKDGRILKVEEMDDLRGTRFKNVRVAFHDSQAKLPEIDGILHAEEDQGVHRFLYQGNLDELVKKLATMDLENLWLEEPALEDIFIHYYERDGDLE